MKRHLFFQLLTLQLVCWAAAIAYGQFDALDIDHPAIRWIHSEAFDALPADARDSIYRRLWEVLSGRDRSSRYAHLSDADRRAIREILVDTKSGLPSYFLN